MCSAFWLMAGMLLLLVAGVTLWPAQRPGLGDVVP